MLHTEKWLLADHYLVESDFFLHDWTHKRPLKYIKGSVHEGPNVIKKKAKLNSYVQQPLAAFSQLSIHKYSFYNNLEFWCSTHNTKDAKSAPQIFEILYLYYKKKCMHAILLWH